MGTIVAIGIVFGAVFLMVYPLFVWFERAFATDYMEARKREWREVATELVLVELQMATAVNAIRKVLGQHPLDFNLTASQFVGPEWEVLRDKCRMDVERSIDSIEGKWRVVR